jgi:glycosyltransferase involved in cell wall biosynthesis
LGLRITTDIHGLERVAPAEMAVRSFPATAWPSRPKRLLRLLASALVSDHLVVHFTLSDVMFFSLMLALVPFHRCRLTTLDFFIGSPRRSRKPLIRWCLNHIDRLLVYFRDASVFEREYGISSQRFHYIPFKINVVESIRRTEVCDCGYIFTGGRSRRDFATFFAAVGPLGYPVKVIASPEAEMKADGSSLAGLTVPPNVEITIDNPSPEFFVRTMAAARLVVLPILRDVTTQAGIGVYLQAMALRKCVIVSTGLGVSDVLTADQALIVPAGDPDALRHAIERAWNDEDLRRRYADAGYRYAQPLGGEDELRRSVLAALPVCRA